MDDIRDMIRNLTQSDIDEFLDNQEFRSHTLGQTMSDVQPKQINWLWPDVIPFGKMTLISGDPGVGKSFLTMDIAAHASAGLSWPGCGDRPTNAINVLVMNCEDGLADTIRPRLDAAGANVRKIRAITGVQRKQDSEPGFFTLDQDIKALERDIVMFDARLIIIDPVSGFLGGCDSHKNAETRALLAPVADLAERRDCAIIMVNHLNKNSAGRAITRSMGSIAFPGASRMSWMVTKDQNDDGKRLLLQQKTNIIKDQQGYAFTIEDTRIVWSDERPIIDLDEALNCDFGRKSKRQEVAEWLKKILLTGPMKVNEIRKAAETEGYSWTTVVRAKEYLGLSSTKHGFGKDAYSEWKLNTK